VSCRSALAGEQWATGVGRGSVLAPRCRRQDRGRSL